MKQMRSPPRVAILVSASCALVVVGCARLGVIDDGSSVSWGASNGGLILRPARLPDRGDGYRVPSKWRGRGLRYGTDELVGMIVHVSRRVAAEYPGSRLTVADMAQEDGGESAHHHSHQSGRDVDLVFFAHDLRGKRLEPADMQCFALCEGQDGRVEAASAATPSVRFDVERNWALVRALVENPVADVQFIFVHEPLRQLLLDYAVSIGEPDDLIAQASAVMQQPGDSLKHDDHFHVRIYCSSDDRLQGCIDRGDLRWTKKDAKHRGGHMLAALPPHLRDVLARPLPAMFALGRLPFSP